MIEWRKLLEQTHPNFQFVKESGETEWISSTKNLKNQIESIPDRLNFKIGEVADHVGVKQYVLRYWESEFDEFQPKKSKNGQRMYTKKDMETALAIRKLLHEDRFSIEGAKSALKKLRKQIKLSNQTNFPNNPRKTKIPLTDKTQIPKTNPKAKEVRTEIKTNRKGSLEKSARLVLESIRQARNSLNL